KTIATTTITVEQRIIGEQYKSDKVPRAKPKSKGKVALRLRASVLPEILGNCVREVHNEFVFACISGGAQRQSRDRPEVLENTTRKLGWAFIGWNVILLGRN